MMDRVIICGYFNYPRGGASANYIEYLAKAFLMAEHEVIIITNLNENVESATLQVRDGIRLLPYEIASGKTAHYIDFNFGKGRHIRHILDSINITSRDVLLAYTPDLFIHKTVIDYAKRSKAICGACVVEWFGKNEYNRYYMNFQYWSFMACFYHYNKKFDFLFPISSLIQSYYRDYGCETMLIPCMMDASVSRADIVYDKAIDKRKFIYSGSGKMKDASDEMLKAISKVVKENAGRVEFHICGIRKNIIEDVIPEAKEYFEKEIIVHSWMEYEELQTLYEEMHFLMLPRKDSRMTKANFPSKVPETMAYGVIPICTEIGDYTDLYVKDGVTGITFKGCDIDVIAEAMNKAINMPIEEYERIAMSCIKLVKEKFDITVWSNKLVEYIESIKMKK